MAWFGANLGMISKFCSYQYLRLESELVSVRWIAMRNMMLPTLMMHSAKEDFQGKVCVWVLYSVIYLAFITTNIRSGTSKRLLCPMLYIVHHSYLFISSSP